MSSLSLLLYVLLPLFVFSLLLLYLFMVKMDDSKDENSFPEGRVREAVNEKVYDTKKAKKVHVRVRSSKRWEALYLSEEGNWFFVGEGTSRFRTGIRDNVQPVTDNHAFRWLEEENAIGALKEHFPEEIENA